MFPLPTYIQTWHTYILHTHTVMHTHMLTACMHACRHANIHIHTHTCVRWCIHLWCIHTFMHARMQTYLAGTFKLRPLGCMRTFLSHFPFFTFFSSTDFHNCKHLAQFFCELAVAACRGCGTQTMRASDLAALCAISNCIFTMCIQRAADASRLAWKPRSRLWKPRSRLMKQKPKKRRVSQHGQGEENVALVLSAAFAQTHPQLWVHTFAQTWEEYS